MCVCCATISMAGDVLPPLIISHRKTIDEEILNSGWRSGQDYIYYYNEKSFMTKTIFQDYIIHTIIQYIDRTRESMKLKDYPAVLLIDNCPSHRCEEIYKELANHNIRLHTHTVCVTYYKASPYNISHTKNIFTAKYNRVI